MARKKSRKTDEEKISEVMSMLAKRSVEARRKAWGDEEYHKRQKAYGKLGGRPKKAKAKAKTKTKTSKAK